MNYLFLRVTLTLKKVTMFPIFLSILSFYVSYGSSVCVIDLNDGCVDHFGFNMCLKAQDMVNRLITQINNGTNRENFFFLECEKALSCTIWNNINRNKGYRTDLCTSEQSRELCMKAKDYYSKLANQYGNLVGYDEVPINCIDYLDDVATSSARSRTDQRFEMFVCFLGVFCLFLAYFYVEYLNHITTM